MDPVGASPTYAVAGEVASTHRGPGRGPEIIAVAYPPTRCIPSPTNTNNKRRSQ